MSSESRTNSAPRGWVAEALKALGVDRLALIVFDSALPQSDAWDVGTGTPYSSLARDLFAFARELGFNGIQFGPQGAVGRDFPSPYDSTLFSRNPLSIALDTLGEIDGLDGAPSASAVAALLEDRPDFVERRSAHAFAFDRHATLIALVTDAMTKELEAGRPSAWKARYETWSARNHDWLLPDAIYHALSIEHGPRRRWPSHDPESTSAFWNLRDEPVAATREPALLGRALPLATSWRLFELQRRHDAVVRPYAFTQFLASLQHEAVHRWAGSVGLELYGDLQIGSSDCDAWYLGWVALPGHRLGAPPSRTNPEGQPWGYPVLDPSLYFEADGTPGPALRLLAWRAERAFLHYDRMRIDHPHGIVCPWVYREGTPNDLHAVQRGARLFSSPDLPDHPDLARFALVAADQLDRTQPRHADGWVRSLSSEQVGRFARAFDVLAERAQQSGGGDRLIVEVLSTLPMELRAVLRRHGLGRFRVTQKARLDDPGDVYRSENSQPEDWLMLGNHDTPPIWELIHHWQGTPEILRQADYLARRFVPDETLRSARIDHLQRDPGELAHAKLADIFAAPARNVAISFLDLFGFEQSFNVPGTVSDENWSLRVPRDFRDVYAERVARGRALSLERALRIALQRAVPDSELLRSDASSGTG